MSLKLSKQYLSWRSLATATLLALTSPHTGLSTNLWAAPPTSVEIAVFKEEDLVKILRDNTPVQKKFEDTDTHVQLDQKILTQKFQFYLDKKGDVRQMLGKSQSPNDPKVSRVYVNAGSQTSYAEYMTDVNPYGNSYFFEVVRPDGSLDRIQIQIPSDASQADIEKLIRDALIARGYTIGDNGSILFNGQPINRSLNDYVLWISGGGQGNRGIPGGGFGGGFGGGNGGGYFFGPGQGNLGQGNNGYWIYQGGNGGQGGPGFNFGANNGSGAYNGAWGGFQGIDTSRYLGSADGAAFVKLGGIGRVFRSDMFDIIDNSKMNNDWFNYEFKLGDLTYKLEKMDIPGLFNDEWVILRKGEGDTWYLIKQDEHQALMQILENSDDPDLVKAFKKVKGKDLHKWDQGDYDNVRKYDMKHNPADYFGFGSNVNFSGSYQGMPQGGFGSGFGGGFGGGFGPGGMGGGSMSIPASVNNDIYTYIQGNPNASIQDLQAMLDAKHGQGMVIVSKDPNGNYQFQFNQAGPQGGPGQMSQFIVVQDPSRFNSGFMMPGMGGGSGQYTWSGGAPSGGSSSSASNVDENALAREIRAMFRNSGSSSSSSSSASASQSRSDGGSAPSSSSSSSSSSMIVTQGQMPTLSRTEDGEWKLSIPFGVDANGDGRIDYYDYEFVYLDPQDVSAEGRISKEALERIMSSFKDRDIDLSRIVTITTAPGENQSTRSSDGNREFRSLEELMNAANEQGWIVKNLNELAGLYEDSNGNQYGWSVKVEPPLELTPENMEKPLKNLVNP
jgi:hypothetical protein